MPNSERKRRLDGNYQASITVGKKKDGRPVRKVIYSKSKKELDKKVDEYKTFLKYGMLIEKEDMTFGEVVEKWKSSKTKISFKTFEFYNSILRNNLLPALSNFKVKEIKAHHLQTIINKLAEGGMGSQLKDIRMLARQIINFAMDHNIVYRNVFTGVKLPRITTTAQRSLTKKEQDLVCSFYGGHRMGVPALLMLFCGIHKRELIALTWDDVDIVNMNLNIIKVAKFEKSKPLVIDPENVAEIRNIPIPEKIITIVKNAKENAQSPMVCPSAKGTIMSYEAYKRAWESYLHYLNMKAGGRDASRSRLKIAMIDDITSQMFRHTYETILFNAGVDVKSTQALLGHTDINTTLKMLKRLERQKKTNAIVYLDKHLKEIFH